MTEQVLSLVSSFSVIPSEKQRLLRESGVQTSPAPAPVSEDPPESGFEEGSQLFGFAARSQVDSQTFAQNKEEEGAEHTSTRDVAKAYRVALEKLRKAQEAQAKDEEPSLVDELVPAFGSEDEATDESLFVPTAVRAIRGEEIEIEEPLSARVAKEIMSTVSETKEQAAEQRAESTQRVLSILRNPELYGFEA